MTSTVATIGAETPLTHLQLSIPEGATVKIYLEQRLFEIKDRTILIPQTLMGELRPYQQEEYRWLKTLLWTGLGGILADDMGLGKTLQTIALILSVFEEQGTVKTLVVVSTSLIDNWMSELNRFAPSLKCVAVTGVTEKRNELFDLWQDYHVFIFESRALGGKRVYTDLYRAGFETATMT